jgi:ATP-dependent helicase/nuclease subunit A
MISPDQKERDQALATEHSFIVQAPAGSGKTELLTQRFLALLAQVRSAPEEIVAITFTRKAAAEMQSRILAALHRAATEPQAPDNAHARKTWELARAALHRDHTEAWQLLENPNRLRIQTIDAFCAYLIRQMPVLSRLGVNPAITDDASILYTQAAQAVLASLEDAQPWSEALASLLLHVDNDFLKAERLFVDMLARRDQWLPYLDITTDANAQRHRLEQALQQVVQENTEQLSGVFHNSLTAEQQAELLSSRNLAPLTELARLEALNIRDPGIWHSLAELLLTKDGQWRKQVTVAQGFPAPSSTKDKNEKELFASMKQRMTDLLKSLEPLESLRNAFIRFLHSPPARYTDTQWHIMVALLELLPILAAHLKLAFQTHGKVDHAEIALSALDALGEFDNPSDLALALDYRIQHILVDEFQDTSALQFQLLEKLTAGWQPNDGRTLFVVGDPMQSIYRFRKAEVGLFLRARQESIGSVKLHPLTLAANFRSQQGIVEWINTVFSQALPAVEDITAGAVSYSASLPIKPAAHSPAVTIHPQNNNDSEAEANTVTQIIQTTLEQYPTAHIGILVRSRSHLQKILPALRNADIAYRAVDIDSLAERMVIQDLLALTRALLNPADRIAWLAILRAPYCGLILSDLYVIAGTDHDVPLWDKILARKTLLLSIDAQQRLNRIVPILSNSIAQHGRIPLHRWIEQTWLALSGPACCENASDLEDANTFFKHLAMLENEQLYFDIQRLEKQLKKLYATPDPRENIRVEIMSLHKAKGLEFDTVILPGLGRQSRSDTNPLLMWMERPRAHIGMDLLLAPITASADDPDPIYQYLRREEAKKNRHEISRLLYVGATRARNTLHLLGHCEPEKKPANNSLLSVLWEPISTIFEQSLPDNQKIDVLLNTTAEKSPRQMKRIVV